MHGFQQTGIPITVRLLSLLLTCLLAATSHAGTQGDYCGYQPANRLGLFAQKLSDAKLGNGDDVSYLDRGLDAEMVLADEESNTTTAGIDYRYTVIGVEGADRPATNGHLHQLAVPLGMSHSLQDGRLSGYITPALAISSNMLKQTSLIDEHALQLWTGLFYRNSIDSNSAWLAGLRSDHRFGEYLLYPVIGYCWQHEEGWQLQLALPDLSLKHQLAGEISIELFVHPEGSKWRVYDSDRTRASDFFYNAIVSGVAIDWQFMTGAALRLGLVKHANRDFSFITESGSKIDTAASSSTGIQLNMSMRF